jgi:16S rRNA (cytosine1402-N4)-methyltransferase
VNGSNAPIDDGNQGHIGHVPVLLGEVMAGLDPKAGQVYVDLTAGRGGHAEAVARQLGPSGRVALFDLDRGNLDFACERVRRTSGIDPVAVHGSFVSVGRELDARGLVADLVLADLGFASTQVDDAERGLSFMRDGPLDMRLDPSSGMTAADLVASTSERDLAEMISRYGEDPLARQIAAKIRAARAVAPIKTTAQLADLVREAYGARAHASRMHPATKTFQALRIAVNDEMGALDALLDSIRRAAQRTREGRPSWLAPQARIAIIGFHSLEDRLVKQAFADLRKNGLAREITSGAVVSSESESAANPRARSAKLRVVMVDGPAAGV